MKRSPLAVVFLVLFGVLLFAGARQTLTDLERATQAKTLIAGISDADAAVSSEKQTTLTQLDILIAAINALPPTPVDCVGTWSAWTQTTACVNGQQDEQRTFSVTTQPANGGQACPASPETRTVSCTAPTPVQGSALYADCTSSPNKLDCISLRDPKQLATKANGGYSWNNSRPPSVTYDAGMDAAKAVVGIYSNQLQNQLHIPVKPYSGSILFIWDAWYGKEMAYAISGIPTYKHFQLACASAICLEVRSRFSLATAPDIAKVDLRYYGTYFGPGTYQGPADTIAPTSGSFTVKPQTWTRYWVYRVPAGAYTEISLWAADQNRAPVLLLDKRLIHTKTINEWWLEMNTSTSTVKAGRPALVSWYRDLLMYQGLSSAQVASKLVKP